MDLERKIGESDIAYHKRLVYGKLEDKTLSGVDYDELSRYLYGKQFSRDVARRLTYGSYRTLKIMDSQVANTPSKEELSFEIAEQTRELQKERQRYFDQRREYKKMLSEEGRREHLEAALAVAAGKLDETVGRIFPDANVIDYLNSIESGTEAVLVFSDWHYGMVADNVFNKYNTKICAERVEHVVHQAVNRMLLHHCSKLHIVILGDVMHGAIHTSARVASEELAADQLMQVSEILAQAIEYLSKFVEHTLVYTTYGNHARTIQNKKDSIHRDNMERIVPWWLRQRLKGLDGITIVSEEENEFLFIEACGHQFVAAHGDMDSVKSSPRLLATLFQKKYGMDIEYVLLGDKHHRESFDEVGICAMICGSLCGTDDYANSKRLYSQPEQLLLIVTKDDGVDAEYRIKC